MSGYWAKLMTNTEHETIRAAATQVADHDRVAEPIRDILQQVADRLEARYHADPAKLLAPQRWFLSLWFVRFYADSDGLAWVAENASAAIPDALEACQQLLLAKTERLLKQVIKSCGGPERMRDDEAMQELWGSDDGTLSEEFEKFDESFFDLQSTESLILAQLRVIAESPTAFVDA